MLYYPIEVGAAYAGNVFEVYMGCSGGRAVVEAGMCVASISGHGMVRDFSPAWDGRLEAEDLVARIGFGAGGAGGGLRGRTFSENEMRELFPERREGAADAMGGRVRIGGFGAVVDVSGSNGNL